MNIYAPKRTDPCVFCRLPLGDGPTALAGAAHPECWETERAKASAAHAFAESLADGQLALYDAPASSTTFVLGRGPYA